MTRSEHLDWCKKRALELLDAGERQQTVTSMLSDLTKWDKPLYDKKLLSVLVLNGMMFASKEDRRTVRHWIEGFN